MRDIYLSILFFIRPFLIPRTITRRLREEPDLTTTKANPHMGKNGVQWDRGLALVHLSIDLYHFCNQRAYRAGFFSL